MSAPIDQQAIAWIVRLRDEDATDADRTAFDLWRAADPRHRAAYDHAVAAAAAFAAIDADARAALDAPARKPGRRTAIAIGVATLAALGVAAFMSLQPKTYVTAVGEQRRVDLSDGSQVELNTDSRLSAHYDPETRRVRLERGEAVFNVVHDASRPFIVEAAGRTVRAVGTQFAVRVGADTLSVVVTEGVVAIAGPIAPSPVATPHEPAPEAERIVASQRFERSGARSGVTTLASADIERSLAWRRGMLEFDGEPLAAAAREVERYQPVRFVIEDPALNDLRIYAYFPANNVDLFLGSLAQSSPDLAIRRDGRIVHIGRAQHLTP